MKKILICGDSFAANWSVKSTQYLGWPDILAKYFNITNLAQAGSSEYKILNQLLSENILLFDAIVIFHTSPYRIYVKQHPYLTNDLLHNQSDLIYNDVKHHEFTDQSAIITFFEKYFDLTYARDIHSLLQEKINQVSLPIPTLHLYIDNNYPDAPNSINVSSIFKKYRGTINHFTKQGNEIIASKVKDWIEHDIR